MLAKRRAHVEKSETTTKASRLVDKKVVEDDKTMGKELG